MREIEDKTNLRRAFYLMKKSTALGESLRHRRGRQGKFFPIKIRRANNQSSRNAAANRRNGRKTRLDVGRFAGPHIYIPVTLHLQIFGRGNGIQLHGKSGFRDAKLFKRRRSKTRRRFCETNANLSAAKKTISVVNVEEFNNQIDQFTASIAAVVVPITLITLIVGGIVVMNIMLVSVTERTFEVGLRKALGATRKQILLQFLIESRCFVSSAEF
jgi:hypothetical protein